MSTNPTLPSDPQSMPLNDLKSAAGLNDPQPVAVPEPAPVATPAPIVPESFTVSQDDSGIVIQMSPEFGGEVFKGKDWAEVGPKIAKAKADANAYIKQLKSQPQVQPQTPQPQKPQLSEEQIATRQWLKNEYEAIEADELGIPVEELRQRKRMAFETGPVTYQDKQVTDFKQACPDFVETPENLQAMEKAFEGVTLQYGFPTAEQLDFAWNYLKGKGIVKPLQPAVSAPAPRGPAPMPGASAATMPSNQNAWEIPLDQLRAQAFTK